MSVCSLMHQRGFAKRFACVKQGTIKFCELIGSGSYSEQKSATDSVGATTVTFSGVNTNSEIRVYLPDTTEVAGTENCVANPSLTWSVYAWGSPNNTVRIVIIHPDYKIKEFDYQSTVGNQSLPVQQERDKWYSNPA